MHMTFRWFGRDDPIPLAHIRHIPGVSGVVSALYDVPVGAAWSRERLERLKGEIEGAGLSFAVVESIPVHEDIKLGRPGRDRLIANYCESVRAMGALRIPVLCYNFMPVFDWLRTDLALPLDGAGVRRPGARRRGPVARDGRSPGVGHGVRAGRAAAAARGVSGRRPAAL